MLFIHGYVDKLEHESMTMFSYFTQRTTHPIGRSSIGAQGARAPPFWRATHANYIATREAHIIGLSTVE